MGDRGLRSQYHSNNNPSWWKWTGPRPTSPTLPVTFENYTNCSNLNLQKKSTMWHNAKYDAQINVC
jgi:hypothetical protein